SGSPVGERRVESAAQGTFKHGNQFEQAERVRQAAAEVEDLPPDRVDPAEGRLVGVEQVVDPERVAHLLAVAEDREWPPGDRRHAEPGDPALIFDAELPRAVDARLTE